jgi:hypothetical protein
MAFPSAPADVLCGAADDISRLASGEFPAVSVCGPSWWARMVRLGAHWDSQALLVAATKPLTSDDSVLIGHAAALLQLRYSADGHRKAAIRLREAVLHLLMAGQATAAQQVAQAMQPALADRIRVHVAEGTRAAREAAADQCQKACEGNAWIIECPVYRRHTIIL